MIVNLTQKFIDTELHIPANKAKLEFVDDTRSGLYVLVSGKSQPTGTFFVRWKNRAKKTCHKKLARTTDITLVEARRQAKALRAEIALGADPQTEEKARKAVLTYDEFFQVYLDYVRPRKRSWKRDEELYRLRIKKVLGHVRLNQITRQQIQSFHTALREEGLAAATCDHHIKLIKHSLNLAIDWNMLEKSPAARVPLYLECNLVEHHLDDGQLQTLLHVLQTDENRAICLIAMYLLSTAARLNEALQATWSQIDRANRVWRIPASNSKSKRIRSVPLNDSAIEVLDQLDTEGKFENLFVNRQTGKSYTAIHKVWDRLRQKAGLPNLRLHDLRHFGASFMINSGRSLYEVQQVLGHSDPKVTQRYAHLSTRSLQAASDSISATMKKAMQVSG